MTVQKIPTVIRNRKIRYLHTERPEKQSLLSFLKKQIAGLLCLITSIILSIPGVPGPGFLFFAMALLLMDYPSKEKLFLYLKKKRFFRITRVLLWKKMTLFMVLPKE
jgi:hypothetical protein